MRHTLTIVAVLVGAGIGLGVVSHDAAAGPLPATTASILQRTLIENAGYSRRYCRRYGCGPDIVVPEGDVDADVDADVAAPVLNPPIIAIVPVRPVSCGEYRYWDGERCVDARYHNPYVGPR